MISSTKWLVPGTRHNFHTTTTSSVIAERLSARQLIVQRRHIVSVYIYIYIYIYYISVTPKFPSHGSHCIQNGCGFQQETTIDKAKSAATSRENWWGRRETVRAADRKRLGRQDEVDVRRSQRLAITRGYVLKLPNCIKASREASLHGQPRMH